MSGLVFEGQNGSHQDVFIFSNGKLEDIAGGNFVGAGNEAGVAGSSVITGNGADSATFGGAPVFGFTNSQGDSLVLFDGEDSNSSYNLMVYDPQKNTTINLELSHTEGKANSVGFDGLDPQDFVTYDGQAFFVGKEGVDGNNTPTLWATNGNVSNLLGGTTDINSQQADYGQMAVLSSNNTLYFTGPGSDGLDDLMSYNALTGKIQTAVAGGLDPQGTVAAKIGSVDYLFFNANATQSDNGVAGSGANVLTNGNLDFYTGGTVPPSSNRFINYNTQAIDIGQGLNPQDLTAVTTSTGATDVLFNGNDVSKSDPMDQLGALYQISAGTGPGGLNVTMVTDSIGRDPQNITALDGKVYFAGTDGIVNGQVNEGLWVYNPATPSVAPTEILKSSNYQLDMNSSNLGFANPQSQISTDGTSLFFTATHGSSNQALFELNPTNNSVTLVSGTNHSAAFNLTHV
jgi:hypothetical protein